MTAAAARLDGGGGGRRAAGGGAGPGRAAATTESGGGAQVVLPGGERVGGAGALPAINRPVAVPRAATVYCMNEAELVDVALGVLAEVSPRLPFVLSAASWPWLRPAGAAFWRGPAWGSG